MLNRSILLTIAVAASLGSLTASASPIYRWRDEGGRANWGDVCPAGAACELTGGLLRKRAYEPRWPKAASNALLPFGTAAANSRSPSHGVFITSRSTFTTQPAPTTQAAPTPAPAPTPVASSPTPTPTPSPDTSTTPPPPTSPTPSPNPQPLLAQEVARDTDLRNHPEILWYPRFDSLENAKADWTFMSPNYQTPYGVNPSVVDAPEFGMKAIRQESMSPANKIGPDGSSVMNWRQYINENTRQVSGPGKTVGNVPKTDLYLRYCVMMEGDVPLGMNDVGSQVLRVRRRSRNGRGNSILAHEA